MLWNNNTGACITERFLMTCLKLQKTSFLYSNPNWVHFCFNTFPNWGGPQKNTVTLPFLFSCSFLNTRSQLGLPAMVLVLRPVIKSLLDWKIEKILFLLILPSSCYIVKWFIERGLLNLYGVFHDVLWLNCAASDATNSLIVWPELNNTISSVPALNSVMPRLNNRISFAIKPIALFFYPSSPLITGPFWIHDLKQ